MLTLEQEVAKLLGEYSDAGKLCLKNLENCDIILQRYKNKLYKDHLSYKLRLGLESIGDYAEENISIVFYENFNSEGDSVEKIDIEFGDIVLTTRCETVTEKRDSREGLKVNFFYKFYVDNYLVLKHEKEGKTKDIINLSRVKKYLEEIKLKISSQSFLQTILKLYTDATLLLKLIEQVQGDGKVPYYKKNYNSDSDEAIDLSDKDA